MSELPTNSTPDLLDLLLELQSLDRVPRTGYALRGVAQCESVTEHTFHLAFLVWALGPRVSGLDTGRAVELALIHDLAEVRTGDLPRIAARYFPTGSKKSAERAVLEEMFEPLGDRASALVDEYESADSIEAQFVRACDKLQLMIKVAVYERWGSGRLGEFWRHPENFTDGGFAPVRELFEALLQRRERRG